MVQCPGKGQGASRSSAANETEGKQGAMWHVLCLEILLTPGGTTAIE